MTVALCLACDEGYLPYASVVAKKAMALSSKPLPSVILCHEVPSDSLKVAKTYVGGDSTFVDASGQLRGLKLSVAPHITKAAYLRLFVDLVPELAQFSKLLYVDCDVEFLKNPCQLAGVELTAAPILAAYDMRFLSSGGHRDYLPMAHDSPYFNSGVLVLNLDTIRREGQLDRARRFASDFPDLCINHDQDALNVGFSEGGRPWIGAGIPCQCFKIDCRTIDFLSGTSPAINHGDDTKSASSPRLFRRGARRFAIPPGLRNSWR